MRATPVAFLFLVGCAGGRGVLEPEPPPPGPAWERLETGFRQLRAGRPLKALAEAEALVAAHPWWVEGHRLAQDARRALFQSGPLLSEYTDLVTAHPDRAEAWYLLGRISGPVSVQEDYFRKALARRPLFPRALGGLAWVLASRGERTQAIALLEQALRIEPDTRDLTLALADRLMEGGREDQARALELLGKLARDAPTDPGPLLRIAVLERGPTGRLAGLKALVLEPEAATSVYGLNVHLEQAGGEAGVAVRLWLERLDRKDPALSLPARLLLARLRARAGDQRGARALLAELAAEAPLEGQDRELLGTLACASGRWEEGLEALLAWIPQDVPLLGPTAGARRALSQARHRPGFADFPALLAQAGFYEAARAAGGAGDQALDRVEQALLMESGLGLLLANGESRKRGLSGLLEDLRALSLSVLGRDVVGRPRQVSVLGAGVYLDPGGPGLPAFFLERGRMLFLGQRLGRPPEAYTGRLVSSVPERLTLNGRRVSIRCWLVEASGLRPSQGLADLAGLALGQDYLIDLDAIRSWAGSLRRQAEKGRQARVLEQPLAPAQGPHGLWSPSDLATKLVVLAEAEQGPPLEERLFELVRHHEQAHLADAVLHLPPLARLTRVAVLLLRAGLSSAGVEADLEARAQGWALARTRWPRLALAQAAGALPAGADGQGGVHDVGYARLVLALARKTPAGTAGLFRLEPAELSRLGRELAEGMGLPEFEVAPQGPGAP